MVSAEPTTTVTSSMLRGMPTKSSSCIIASSVASLDTKPSSGGIPAIDIAGRMARMYSAGFFLPRPASLSMSLVPAEWSMAPTIMKSAALKRECAKVSARPACMASREPMAMMAVIKPSCETVP